MQLLNNITFISPYCSMDAFSARAEKRFYPVNSLGFGKRGLEVLKQRLWGNESRFNMRARAYDNGDAAPYFLEIKHKTGTCVKKYRTTLNDSEWISAGRTVSGSAGVLTIECGLDVSKVCDH